MLDGQVGMVDPFEKYDLRVRGPMCANYQAATAEACLAKRGATAAPSSRGICSHNQDEHGDTICYHSRSDLCRAVQKHWVTVLLAI